MADRQYRLRIKLGAGEFESEGSEEFIEKYWKEVQHLIADAATLSYSAENDGSKIAAPLKSNDKEALPNSFGEYLNSFGKLTKTNEVLIAGYYVTHGNSDSVFTSNEARDLLKEHGVNVSSASGLISNLLKSGKVFRNGAKAFRVSKEGIEYIAELLSKE